jgi:hypothetical protein
LRLRHHATSRAREAADPDRAREAANCLSSQSIQERLRDNIHVISSLALWDSAKWLAASQSSQALHRS